jgi:ketosteroid isomerase-like protein
MTTHANRTAQDVFRDHAQAMASGDLARIVGAYADDAVFITHAGVLHGKGGVHVIGGSDRTRGRTRAFSSTPPSILDRG